MKMSVKRSRIGFLSDILIFFKFGGAHSLTTGSRDVESAVGKAEKAEWDFLTLSKLSFFIFGVVFCRFSYYKSLILLTKGFSYIICYISESESMLFGTDNYF